MSGLLVAGLLLAIEAAPSVRWSVACDLPDEVRVALDGAGSLQVPIEAQRADCMITLRAGPQLTVTLADAEGFRARSTLAGAGSTSRLRRS